MTSWDLLTPSQEIGLSIWFKVQSDRVVEVCSHLMSSQYEYCGDLDQLFFENSHFKRLVKDINFLLLRVLKRTSWQNSECHDVKQTCSEGWEAWWGLRMPVSPSPRWRHMTLAISSVRLPPHTPPHSLATWWYISTVPSRLLLTCPSSVWGSHGTLFVVCYLYLDPSLRNLFNSCHAVERKSGRNQ